jgi:carboxypeptidase C (cathepsin A)
MQVQHSIKVDYQTTSDAATASEWLQTLPDMFAADFEAALRYPKEDIDNAKKILKLGSNELTKKELIHYQSLANASALGHPSHCIITHCSIAFSEKDAFVFIIDNQEIADTVLDFLTETDSTQVWHNYCYDGRLIRYYQGTDAKNVEDTQILAKTLINHSDVRKAGTRLKDLAGSWYGDWGISADNFNLDQQYEEHVLKYAAIDACATYKLWEYLNDFIRENN